MGPLFTNAVITVVTDIKLCADMLHPLNPHVAHIFPTYLEIRVYIHMKQHIIVVKSQK